MGGCCTESVPALPLQLLTRFADDYDKFWTVASKLFPLPSPVTTSSPATLSPAPSQERAPSPSSNDGRMPDGNGVRNVPIRIHLPGGAPVMQDLTPPVVEGAGLAHDQRMC